MHDRIGHGEAGHAGEKRKAADAHPMHNRQNVAQIEPEDQGHRKDRPVRTAQQNRDKSQYDGNGKDQRKRHQHLPPAAG